MYCISHFAAGVASIITITLLLYGIHLLPVRIAGSYHLETLAEGDLLSIQRSITHDLLDHTHRLCGVGFIKEQNCIHWTVSNGCSISLGHCLCLPDFLDDVLTCGAAMDRYTEQNWVNTSSFPLYTCTVCMVSCLMVADWNTIMNFSPQSK